MAMCTSRPQSCHDCAGKTRMAMRQRKDKKNSTLLIILTGRVLLLLSGLCYATRYFQGLSPALRSRRLATLLVFLLLLSLSTTEATALHLAHDLADLVKLLDEPIDLSNRGTATLSDALAA